jgi:acyl-CoA synthetase (NDP forming)/GNAT superfamily N-acetyltransferase
VNEPGARGVDVLLSDGSTVHVRQISPNDADRVVAMHARFSERTRYLRFFAPYPRIPQRDLRRFVNVDHRDREALVVAVGDDLIAVGRYDRLGSGAPDAEVAFVVEDRYQGRGVGSMLLEHLAAAAARVGITRFVAEVLPQNGPMLRVFADAGYQVSREYADGVVHLTFPIAPTMRSIEVQRDREQRTEAASIARLLAPGSVAVYGVRRNGTGAGAALLRHVLDGGFAGPVYPIHPTASTLGGLPAFTSAAEAPGPVDLALVAVPVAAAGRAVADAGQAGARGAVVVTAGFAETGEAGARRQRSLVTRARANRLRLVGPNGLGAINTDPAVRLNASLAPRLPERGRVGVFCQSAALAIATLAEAADRGLGLSTFVSAGNRADVSGNDLLQYWRADPHTDVVLLYLETFGNPRKFARIARDLGRDKPVVAVAAGSATDGSGAGPRDAAAMAALFAESGVIRVDTIREMFDVGQVLAHQPLPAGDRVGIVGNAPALAELAAGSCTRAGLRVPVPARAVPPDSRPQVLADAVRAVVADSGVDCVLVVLAPPLPGSGLDEASGRGAVYDEAVNAAAAQADKPVLATLVGPPSRRSSAVPRFGTVEESVRALARVCRYAGWRREPAGGVSQLSDVDEAAARRAIDVHDAVEELLAAYGVRVIPDQEAASVTEALAAASELGYPVAVKSAAPFLRHRIDLGAVRLDVGDDSALRRSYEELAARFGPGVLIQPMVRPGIACVVEVVDDPAFGPLVGFGLGGIALDLLGDQAWRAAPLSDSAAAALVRAPAASAMLRGYRGAAPVDEAALADLLVRMGRLADEQPGVKRLELNPVLAHESGLAVLHAAATYGAADARPDTGPRHLRQT